MKTNRLVLAALVSSALLSTNALAADGTITFTGSITASACTTVVGASSAGSAAATPATVALPSVPTTALPTAGGFAGHTAFNIQLSGCQATAALTNVRALFTTAAAEPSDVYVMKNTAVGGAANVGVAILTPAGAPIDLNGGSNVDPGVALPPVGGTPGPITMNYQAAYKALTTGAVGAGTVTANADYTISYY